MHSQSRLDWARFEPAAIPTKQLTPQLERWLDRLALPPGARVLDLGCGAGEIARALEQRGFQVVGVDINAAAIEALQRSSLAARFYVRDIAASDFALAELPFDALVCQLVLSVIGDAADRKRLLRNARGALRSGGALFASFSGLSDDVNAEYAQLYTSDFAQTREHATYLSRDADGRVLYRTHHFAKVEVRELLEGAGLEAIEIEASVEASSRRPDQRARFWYASGRRSR